MLLIPLIASLAAVPALAQLTMADLEGTWSSGTNYVSTGGDFCSPSLSHFTVPNNTGMSYSFTADGFFEEAQYRYKSNPADPNCIQAVLWWQHGTYKLEDDNTLSMTPWPTDGRVQTQTRCSGTSEAQVYYYNEKGLFKSYALQVRVNPARPDLGANMALITQAFDGAKNPPMYLIAKPPNMLPTQVLTGTNGTGQTIGRRSFIPVQAVEKRSEATSAATAVAAPALLLGAAGLLAALV